MASVAEQLKALKWSERRDASERVASLLYTQDQAAGLDPETVRVSSEAAFDRLCSLCSGFRKYAVLFARSSSSIVRDTQTAEQNKSLDKQIDGFLLLLSPYIQQPPAQRAFEWLLRKYRVHEENISSVLRCILPYHTTKIFVRIVQLLKLQKYPQWQWLRPVQKQGVPVDRQVLVKFASANRGILRMVCDSAVDASAVLGASESTNFVTLFASVVTGVVSSGVSEDSLTVVSPFLLSGLKSTNPQLQAASYMLIAQLCACATLEAKVAASLFEAVSCSLRDPPSVDAVKCLVVICHTQQMESIPNRALRGLCTCAELPTVLSKVAEGVDVSKLAVITAEALLGSLDRKTESFTALVDFMEQVHLPDHVAERIGRRTISRYTKASSDADISKLKSQAAQILGIIDKKYPQAVSAVVNGLPSMSMSDDKVKKMELDDVKSSCKDLLDVALGSLRHRILPGIDATLSSALQHHIPSIRIQALKALQVTLAPGADVDENDMKFLRECLAARLVDSDGAVVRATIALGDTLLGFVPADIVRTILIEKLYRGIYDGDEEQCEPKLVARIGGFLAGSLFLADPRAAGEIACALLPLMVAARNPKTSRLLVQAIVDSPMSENDGIFACLKDLASKKEWASLGKKSSQSEIINANQLLFRQIGRNIHEAAINGDWDPCDSLIYGLQTLSVTQSSLDDTPVMHCILTVLSEAAVETNDFPTWLNILNRATSLIRVATSSGTAVKSSAISGFVEPPSESNQVPQSCSKHIYNGLQQLMQPETAPPTAGARQFLRHLAHLIATVPEQDGSHSEGLEAAIPKLWECMFESGASLKTCANVVQLFFAKLVTCTSLEWAKNLCIATADMVPPARMRVSESVEAILSARTSGTLDNSTAESLIALFCPLLVLIADSSESVRQASISAASILAKLASESTCKATRWRGLLLHITGLWDELSRHLIELADDVELLPKLLAEYFNKGTIEFAIPIQDLLCRAVFSNDSPRYRERVSLLLSHTESPAKFERYWPECVSLVRAVVDNDGENNVVANLDMQLVEAAAKGITPKTVSLFVPKKGHLDGLIEILNLKSGAQSGFDATLDVLQFTQKAVLQQLGNVNVATALPKAARTGLFKAMYNFYEGCSSSPLAAVTQQALSAIPVDGNVILDMLQSHLHSSTAPASSSVETHVGKRRRIQSNEVEERLSDNTSSTRTADAILDVEVILDIITFKELKTISSAAVLVGPLFDLVGLCNGLDAEQQLLVEHIKQMIFDALASVCIGIPEDELVEDRLDIESIVRCIKLSSNPQTHNHALLLLAQLASRYPQCVLDSIMPIFTFMGTSVVRHDDNYSFHVVERTIATVIPALTGHSITDRDDVVVPLLGVFVDTLTHIPQHRRLPLFCHLLRTLGAADHLHIVCTLIIKSIVMGMKTNQELSADHDQPLSFTLQLRGEMEGRAQLSCLFKLIDNVVEMCADSPQQSAHSRMLFDISKHTPKQTRHFLYLVLSFVSRSLSSKPFLASIAQTEDTGSFKDKCLDLIRLALAGSARVSDIDEDEGVSAIKYRKAATEKFYDIVDKTNSLLSVSDFVDVVRMLLKHDDIVVRRKALMLYTDRVGNDESPTDQDVQAYLELVDVLMGIARESSSAEGLESRDLVFCQTALYALAGLMASFGSSHSDLFEGTLDIATDILRKSDKHYQLQANAAVCLGAYCMMVKVAVIKHLPQVMPVLLESFISVLPVIADKEEMVEEEIYLLTQSLCAALGVFIDVVPQFLAPYLKKILAVVTHPCFDPSLESTDSKANIVDEVQATRAKIAQSTPGRILTPALFAAYNAIISTNIEDSAPSVTLLAGILETSIDNMDRAERTSNSKQIFKFFLVAFDYRTKMSEVNSEVNVDIDLAEESMISAFTALVLRLSESSFKPMLWKLIDWTGQAHEQFRNHVLHRLACTLSGQLKSLFVPYFAYLMKSFLAMLDSKGTDGIGSTTLKFTTMSFSNCFRYDDTGFVTSERFEALKPRLTALLEVLPEEAAEDYIERTTTVVSPCITQFAVACKSHLMWKPLNDELIHYCQHPDHLVRRGVLVVLEDIYKVLGGEFINLLPDTVPSLMELMEDDNQDVETQARHFVKVVERHLGEPLADYFQ